LQLWQTAPTGDGLTRLTSDTGQPVNTDPDWQPLHQTAIAPGAPSAPRAGHVTPSGSDFLTGGTIKLAFVAANGTKVGLGTVHADGTGAFAATLTIPSTAPRRSGTIKATGTGGLSATAPFTVS